MPSCCPRTTLGQSCVPDSKQEAALHQVKNCSRMKQESQQHPDLPCSTELCVLRSYTQIFDILLSNTTGQHFPDTAGDVGAPLALRTELGFGLGLLWTHHNLGMGQHRGRLRAKPP